MKPYTDIDALQDVVLEESWIRSVVASPGRLMVMLEAVIAKDSPLLKPPRPGEMYFWLPGILQFEGVSDLRWRDPQPPNQEIDGTTNFDTLDHLSFEADRYHLESAAGIIDLVAQEITLQLDHGAGHGRPH